MHKIKIISRTIKKEGATFKIQTKERSAEVIMTSHALERIKRWRMKESEILCALVFAEEVIIGHGGRFIAHKLRNNHIIRVIYEYRNDTPKVITVYTPSKTRYFQGGGKYANKILP